MHDQGLRPSYCPDFLCVRHRLDASNMGVLLSQLSMWLGFRHYPFQATALLVEEDSRAVGNAQCVKLWRHVPFSGDCGLRHVERFQRPCRGTTGPLRQYVSMPGIKLLQRPISPVFSLSLDVLAYFLVIDLPFPPSGLSCRTATPDTTYKCRGPPDKSLR